MEESVSTYLNRHRNILNMPGTSHQPPLPHANTGGSQTPQKNRGIPRRQANASGCRTEGRYDQPSH